MKLTQVVKSTLNIVPGYKRWAFNRSIRLLQKGKDNLLARAKTRLVPNPQTQELEPLYSVSVQRVLDYYNREMERQSRAFYAEAAPDLSKGVEAARA